MDNYYGNIVYNNQIPDMSGAGPMDPNQHHVVMGHDDKDMHYQRESIINVFPQEAEQQMQQSENVVVVQPTPGDDCIQEQVAAAEFDSIIEEERLEDEPEVPQPTEQQDAKPDELDASVSVEKEESAEAKPETEDAEVKVGADAEPEDEVKKEEGDMANEEGGEGKEEEEEIESNLAERKKKQEEEQLNPNQCRVCMSTENLNDIFEFISEFRACDLIMKIVPNIKISEKDHLPKFICASCVEKVKISYELKTTCENSDREFRKNMKRSQAKTRAAKEYILVNCPLTDSDDDDIPDDDDYKVSNSEEEEVDSDASFEPPTKKKKTPKKKPPKPAPKSVTKSKRKPAPPPPKPAIKKKKKAAPPPPPPKSSLKNVVYIEAPNISPSSSDDEDDEPLKARSAASPSKSGIKASPKNPGRFECHLCERIFTIQHNLNQHLKKHETDRLKAEGNKPIIVEKKPAPKPVPKKKVEEPKPKPKPKPKPALVVVAKPAIGKKPRDQPAEKTGRDLFKTVAPVTSTYWSDSFSD